MIQFLFGSLRFTSPLSQEAVKSGSWSFPLVLSRRHPVEALFCPPLPTHGFIPALPFWGSDACTRGEGSHHPAHLENKH